MRFSIPGSHITPAKRYWLHRILPQGLLRQVPKLCSFPRQATLSSQILLRTLLNLERIFTVVKNDGQPKNFLHKKISILFKLRILLD